MGESRKFESSKRANRCLTGERAGKKRMLDRCEVLESLVCGIAERTGCHYGKQHHERGEEGRRERAQSHLDGNSQSISSLLLAPQKWSSACLLQRAKRSEGERPGMSGTPDDERGSPAPTTSKTRPRTTKGKSRDGRCRSRRREMPREVKMGEWGGLEPPATTSQSWPTPSSPPSFPFHAARK